eukprot:TRINITY_DN3619_c0_g1_i8.p2 TRINITY_DN3619_c0_g1~~TRINITY_DN3619_c0_g1_i8.p2  ORF type:complete len:122 (+),score=3.47 TRINITY_DN3619_c0_g1_i8:141-506(+)
MRSKSIYAKEIYLLYAISHTAPINYLDTGLFDISIKNQLMKPVLSFSSSFKSISSFVILCHYCEKVIKDSEDVWCTNINCVEHYCRGCLVRLFRFSRKDVKRLPTRSWKCPKCQRRCCCEK